MVFGSYEYNFEGVKFDIQKELIQVGAYYYAYFLHLYSIRFSELIYFGLS